MIPLENYRKEIDKINYEILRLIAKRVSIIKKIGKYKRKFNIPLTNKKREKEILQKIKRQARSLKVKGKFAKKLFEIIIKESRKIQKR